MSPTLVGTEETNVTTANGADNQRKADALRRMISRGQGRFVFAPVEFDLPSLQNEALAKLRESFPDLNIVTVKLSPPPLDAPRALTVLDQLEDLVKLHSPDKAPDALIITGYETLFADAVADESKPSYNLRRAIQPLNLGRNVFAEKFPCPVLLCLPPAAMGVFLRSAPDLVSWRSGYYKFESDLEAKRAELRQSARAGVGWLARWRMRRRKPEDLLDENKRLESLIADAEALTAEKTLIVRLYQRLGWTAVALRDRMQARWAFAQMLRLAREAEDQRLVSAAVKGQRAADNVTPVARVSPQQAEATQEVFRGAAALTEAEGPSGREDELRELISRVTFVGTRFMTVWGETGCGKTSLVFTGLLPELKRQGLYLPVVVRQWDEPEANIRRALENVGRNDRLPTSPQVADEGRVGKPSVCPTLHDCVQQIAQQTQKTVVVICDQFEQFFTTYTLRSERMPLLKAIGACVNDLRIPCKFIFIVREDHLGRMVEFESDVPEAIEQRKRFYLPLFNAADAVRVLRKQADEVGLDWPEVFVRTIVNDLIRDERVRPIELQLVGEALAVSGISNELDYARAGRAKGLMDDYLQLMLDNLAQSKSLAQMAKRKLLAFLLYLPSSLRNRDNWDQRNRMERILLTLVAEPAGRLALTADEIAQRTGIKLSIVLPLLELLVQSHLLRQVDEPSSAEQSIDRSAGRYELTHDVLINLMPMIWLENRRWASRLLIRALEEVNPRYTISLYECRLFKEYCDEGALEEPKIKALLRRSFIWGHIKKFMVWLIWLIIFVFTVLAIAPKNTFLPTRIGELLLYAGLTRPGIEVITGALKSNASNVRSDAVQTLRNEIRRHPGIATNIFQSLLEAIKDSDDWVRRDAASALGQVAQANPSLANQALYPLLTALKDSDGYMRRAAASALGEVVQADRSLAGQTLQSLLDLLKDSDGSVRRVAASALGEVVQADHSLAGQTLQSLLALLKDSNDDVRSAAASALGEVVQADRSLAGQTLQSLLALLKESDDDVRRVAIWALGEVAQADHNLASQILQLLLAALKDNDDEVRSTALSALGEVAQADNSLASQTLQPLLTALKDNDDDVRQAAASTVGRVVYADYSLANQFLQPLLTTLKDDEYSVGSAVWSSFPYLLFGFAVDQAKNGHDPLQFLFDHLEGRQSLIPDGSANTHVAYRDIAIGAMARWLASDKPEINPTKEALRQRLRQMLSQDNQPHLRTAARRVFNEVNTLRDKQRRGEN